MIIFSNGIKPSGGIMAYKKLTGIFLLPTSLFRIMLIKIVP